MTLHLLRPAAGCDSLYMLSQRQRHFNTLYQGRVVPLISTKRKPVRMEDLKKGGSVFWIIKRVIQARQTILDGEIIEAKDESGSRCHIYLDPTLIKTELFPHNTFQGWRYLEPYKAPKDIGEYIGGEDGNEIDPKMQVELRDLGLL